MASGDYAGAGFVLRGHYSTRRSRVVCLREEPQREARGRIGWITTVMMTSRPRSSKLKWQTTSLLLLTASRSQRLGCRCVSMKRGFNQVTGFRCLRSMACIDPKWQTDENERRHAGQVRTGPWARRSCSRAPTIDPKQCRRTTGPRRRKAGICL